MAVREQTRGKHVANRKTIVLSSKYTVILQRSECLDCGGSCVSPLESIEPAYNMYASLKVEGENQRKSFSDFCGWKTDCHGCDWRQPRDSWERERLDVRKRVIILSLSPPSPLTPTIGKIRI